MAATRDDVRPGVPRTPTVDVRREDKWESVSWAALFAGTVIAVSVQLLLSALGAGVGLEVVQGDTPDAVSIGIGAGIWWIASMMIALAVGGYVASQLGGLRRDIDGALHGLVIWGLTLLLTVYLLTTAVGALVGGAFSALGDTVAAVGQGAEAAAPAVASAVDLDVEAQAQDFLQPTPGDLATMDREEAAGAIARLLPDLLSSGPEADRARQQIIDIVAAQQGISNEEAAQQVNEVEGQINDARDEATRVAADAAEASADVASQAAFLIFGAAVAGAIAAAAGGVSGTRRPDRYEDVRVR